MSMIIPNRIKWFFRFQSMAWRRLFRSDRTASHLDTINGTALWHDVMTTPAISHPSEDCHCDTSLTEFDQKIGHRYDCTWAKVMCRSCSGRGTCGDCGGDGVAPTLPNPDLGCDHTSIERCPICADVSYLKCGSCTTNLAIYNQLCGLHRFPPTNPES